MLQFEPANPFVIDLADVHRCGTSSYSTSGLWRGCFGLHLYYFRSV